jgi:hypothetical protein
MNKNCRIAAEAAVGNLPPSCAINIEAHRITGCAPACYEDCLGYDETAGMCANSALVYPIQIFKPVFLEPKKSRQWLAMLDHPALTMMLDTMLNVVFESEGYACMDCSLFQESKCQLLAWVREHAYGYIEKLIPLREQQPPPVKQLTDNNIRHLSIIVEKIRAYESFISKGKEVGPTPEKISDFIKLAPVPGPGGPAGGGGFEVAEEDEGGDVCDECGHDWEDVVEGCGHCVNEH